MPFGEFQERLLCLRLRDTIDKNPVARTQGELLCDGVPVLVGQRCSDQWIGKIHKGSESSSEGDMFDAGSDSLADDIECSLSGDLRTVGVS